MSDQETRHTSFAVLTAGLALTVLFNYGAYSMGKTPLIVVTVLLALVNLAWPRFPLALGAMYASYCLQYSIDTRVYRVHTHFDFVLGLAVLATLALTYWGPKEHWRTRFVYVFAPVGLSIAGISFFAAGLAKVNTDFITVKHSCATVFYEWSRTVFPYSLLPTGKRMIYGVVALTWICELGGPLLLLHPATRRWGFLMILLLAFLLGTNPYACYYEFTSPFLALGLLGFVHEDLHERWVGTRAGGWLSARYSALSWLVLAIFGGCALAAMLAGDRGTAEDLRLAVTRAVFVVWVLSFVLPVAVLAPVARLLDRPSQPLVSHLAWLSVLFVLVQEGTSYVGIRAEGAFAMAANFSLSTLHSNHLLVREVPALPFNRMVVLEDSSAPELALHGSRAWPDWMLFDFLARHPEHWAVVSRGGVEERFEPGSTDPRIRRSLFAKILPAMKVSVRTSIICAHELPKGSRYARD